MILAWMALANATPTAEDPTGTWALQLRLVTANRVPIFGKLESTGQTFIRARIQADGDTWQQEHTVCGAQVRGGVVRTRIPSTYTRSVPVKTYPAVIAGGRYHADLGVFRTGHYPRCKDVPLTAEDPCVYDWDSDGHPGATIEVKAPMFSWVEVYVAQRNHIVLDGSFVGPERIEGTLQVLDLKNHVLGASRSLFDRNPVSELVPESSGFTMTRLPDDATCVEVLEHSQK